MRLTPTLLQPTDYLEFEFKFGKKILWFDSILFLENKEPCIQFLILRYKKKL